jgi:hypothetical protein
MPFSASAAAAAGPMPVISVMADDIRYSPRLSCSQKNYNIQFLHYVIEKAMFIILQVAIC